jgi:hypothetical protein
VPSSDRLPRKTRYFAGKRAILGALAGAALTGFALVMGAACGGGTHGPKPTATLASSPEAAIEFHLILQEWSNIDKARSALRLRIERFVRKFPDDGLAPLARVYLSFLLMDEGNFAAADEQLAALATLPYGATRDFALVAQARALRQKNRAEEAFELLQPLAGKIVDLDARERFQEEIALDAFAAHHDYEAIAYMDTWLRYADEDEKERARLKIPVALSKMKPEVLEGSLRSMRLHAHPGMEIQRLIATRLAVVAVEKGDTRLAQWLVDPAAGAPFLGLDAGLMVSELATRHHGVTAISGRTIGLVLPTGSPAMRDAAADVARGVAWALNLPRSNPAAGDGTRLVTRDRGGSDDAIEPILEDLAGDGAAIIIAGFDPTSVDSAMRWSERSAVPVVILASPPAPRPAHFAFVLAEPNANVLNALAEALVARRENKVAIISDRETIRDVATAFGTRKSLTLFEPVSCDLDAMRPGEARFPLGVWERAGFRTWLISGPESCAREALHEIGQLRGGLIALTLEAAGGVERGLPARVISASAGVIPVLVSRNGDAGADKIDPGVRSFMGSFGATPTWRTALGRDAGILARAAVLNLPLDEAVAPAEVTRRRELVRKEFAAAKQHLWTSEAEGVDASNALPRTLRIIEVPR